MGLMRAILANRGIVRCEAGWAVSALGTWTFSIVLALYAYYEHGPGGVGLAVATRMLPAALFVPFAARIVELRSRRTALVVSALARFAVLEAIALVVAVEGPFTLLLGLAAVFEIAGTIHRSARTALLIELARAPAELASLSVSGAVGSAGFLAGGVAAGILVSIGSTAMAFGVAGLAFLVVAGLGSALPTATRQPASPRRRSSFKASVGAIQTLRRHPWIRMRVGLFGASVLVQSMLELLLVLAALDLLKLGGSGVGWLRAALAAGALLGGAVAAAVLGAGRFAAGLAAGLVLAGVPLALVAAWPQTVPALLLIGLLGVGFALLESALLFLTPRLAFPDTHAHVIAIEEFAYPIARAVGAGLATWFVVQLGDSEAFVATGVLLPVLAIVLLRPLTRVDRDTRVPDSAFRRLRELPLFAQLPNATIENLALRATPDRFAAGQTIMRAGHENDCFYLIERGGVERRAHGQASEHLGEGQCFGEDALLRGALPRSTVSAVTAVTTLTITHTDFMSCVSEPAPSFFAARAAGVKQPQRRPPARRKAAGV